MRAAGVEGLEKAAAEAAVAITRAAILMVAWWFGLNGSKLATDDITSSEPAGNYFRDLISS